MAGGYGVPARSHRHPRAAPPGRTGTADVVVLAVVVARRRRHEVVAGRRRAARCRRSVSPGRHGSPLRPSCWPPCAVPRADGGVGRPAARSSSGRSAAGRGRRSTRSASPGATRVVLSIERRALRGVGAGRARSRRAADVAGRRPGAGGRHARAARRRPAGCGSPAQHVVGALAADWFGDVVAGDRAGRRPSNRVRAVIARGAGHLGADQAALTRGLVIGDDRDEPPAMVQRFRDAGLSHLTAVSGQNVALHARRRRPAAAPDAAGGAVGGVARPDRLVRRADPRRAVRAAGRDDGGAGGDRVPARAPGRAAAAARPRRRSPCCSSIRCWPGRSASGCPSAPRPASSSAPCTSPHGSPASARWRCRSAVTLGAQCGVAVPSLLVFGRLSLDRARWPTSSPSRSPAW